MIRCAICPTRPPLSDHCSPLATITLHWMHDHPARYLGMHPEAKPYLEDAGLL